MATLDQLFQAMGMFKQASQEYGIQKGIEDATNTVKQITANMAPDPMKQLEAQSLVANQLQAQLAGLGAPQSQIAAAVGAIAPEIPKTPEQIRQKALAATSKEEQMFWEQKADIAQNMMGQGKLAEELPKMQQEQDFALERERVKESIAQKAAQLKATTSLSKEENQRLFEVSRQYEEKATPLRQALRQADTAFQLLASGNPVGESAAINGLVKASGDTGVITESDRQAFGGSKAYTSKLQRAASQAATGKLDKESREFLKSVADLYRKKQAKELETYADRFSKRVVNSLGVDQDRALSIVDPELYDQRRKAAEDQQALVWAKANPNHPKAKAILQLLGK